MGKLGTEGTAAAEEEEEEGGGGGGGGRSGRPERGMRSSRRRDEGLRTQPGWGRTGAAGACRGVRGRGSADPGEGGGRVRQLRLPPGPASSPRPFPPFFRLSLHEPQAVHPPPPRTRARAHVPFASSAPLAPANFPAHRPPNSTPT